jgi:hypothetical protein
MCISLSLLSNGSVKTLPRQRIHKQQRIVERVSFYVVRVVSKEELFVSLVHRAKKYATVEVKHTERKLQTGV